MGEWEQRRLCPDGSCVGVIGPDGRCTVCREVDPTWTATPREARAADADDDDDDEGDGLPDSAADAGLAAAADAPPSDWDERTLCADGACTGLIPAPGAKCTVCGRTAAEITAESAG
jgi:hypothetical protein